MKDILVPAAVLTGIALVVTAMLAFTNALTKPIIDENQKREADSAKYEMLPNADNFTSADLTGDLTALGVGDLSLADNGAGAVVTVTQKGYNGEFSIMVAFNPDGAVVAFKALVQDETAGLGSNAFIPPFADQFTGKNPGELTVVKGPAGGADEISSVTGATISSKAVTLAINNAGKAFALAKEAA